MKTIKNGKEFKVTVKMVVTIEVPVDMYDPLQYSTKKRAQFLADVKDKFNTETIQVTGYEW